MADKRRLVLKEEKIYITLRMRADIRRKEKVQKETEFAERIKKVQEEAKTVLNKAQEIMKQQANKKRKKAEK